MLESTSPAASHTHTASTICFSPSMPSSFSRLHFGSATWQACCCGWEESSAFWTPQTGADSPGWLFDVSEDNRPPGLCGTSLFCQVVSQRRRRCVHNWTATHCRGKWVREKDLFFFPFTVSHTAISLPLLCVSWHRLFSTYFPFLWTAADVLLFLLLFLFRFKVLLSSPQFIGARRSHHAGSSIAETIASATGESKSRKP